MVDAICRDGARQLEMPAPPPTVRTATDVAEAFLGRLDGSAFDAPTRLAGDVATRMERWGRSVTGERGRLIVRLDPPDDSNAWHLAVFATGARGEPLPIEQAIVNAGSGRPHLEDEITRLERMLPALLRPGGTRRGEVVLSQDEAWDLMATTGPQLEAAGFDVRVPALSRRKPTPSLRVFVDAAPESVVGANQLANVRWSAVFDDVELSAADIARLAREARPLIRSGGRWVALDKADLQAAADALAERADTKQLSGAETLRLALGIEGSSLAGGVSVVGGGWAAELLEAAAEVSASPGTTPEGFVGDLRSYQAEALAWLGFLGKAGLGGCLALDMGLGKTPTMLADLLDSAGSGPALVIAPPAVVGNWTAEAARFTPGLRVVVHHGANRADADELAAEVARADVVVTTYGTAVRDIEAISAVSWSKVVLDEAQAIKNPANDTSQQLRRIPARTRIALTGTPIENGLGDLWAILDFANPGLIGPRPQFIARLSNDGRAARVEAEDAMRALNGILVFRRTKAEPAIAEELPDQIDELDRCAMTAEQIGLYQALLDTLVTGTAVPEGESGKARNGHILAAITALKQICNHPAAYQDDDLPLAGRSGKLAAPRGDRRRRLRRGRERARVHALRAVGPEAGRPSHQTHRHAGCLLPRRSVARRPRSDHRRLPRRRRSAGARALVEGRRYGAQSDGGEPRRAVRPVVEPRGRRPSARPCVANRPDAHGHLPPADLSRNRRRAGGGGRRGQASHRRSRAAEVELARRPRQ